jgi:hypothetical protein
MKRSSRTTPPDGSERGALRKRVRQFYVRFNDEDWAGCYSLLDPQLTEGKKVELATYSERMRVFKEVYGSVKLWLVRLNLHLAPSPTQRDKRPFAYAYVIWQDDTHAFHLFRERWIKDGDRWFTRVVGLVPNKQASVSREG